MIRKTGGICGLIALLVLATAGAAKADTLDSFSYTTGGNTFVWQLPASPIPDSGDVYYGIAFVLNDVPVSENGGNPILGQFGFYNAANAGGFDLALGDIFLTSGWTQLYTGTETNPGFLTGIFLLDEYGSVNSALLTTDESPGVLGTLVISSTAVPEPTTFSLLILGALGLLVAAPRKR